MINNQTFIMSVQPPVGVERAFNLSTDHAEVMKWLASWTCIEVILNFLMLEAR